MISTNRFFAFLVLTILFFGCTSSSNISNKKINNQSLKSYETGDISFNCPEDWTNSTMEKIDHADYSCSQKNGGIITFITPKGNNFNLTDILFYINSKFTALGGGEFNSDVVVNTSIGNLSASSANYNFIRGSTTFKGKVILFSCNEKTIAVTTIDDAMSYDKNVENYELIYASVNCNQTNKTKRPQDFMCNLYGNSTNMSKANYAVYTILNIYSTENDGYILQRFDDYCASDYEVMKVRCYPNEGVISGSSRSFCPVATRCLDGACVSYEDYQKNGQCGDKSGSDGTFELCNYFTFTHDTGIGFKPSIELINPQTSTYRAKISLIGAHLKNGSKEFTIGFTDYEVIKDNSSEEIFIRPYQFDVNKLVVNVWSQNGILLDNLE